MKINELLANRHSMKLTWNEPWPKRTSDGKEDLASVQISALIDDCIDMQRDLFVNETKLGTEVPSDKVLLEKFINYNDATLVDPV